MAGLFEQFGVNPGDVMQRANGRPMGVRDGMGQQRAGVMNPTLQGMQFTGSPIAGGPRPMPGSMGQGAMTQPMGGLPPMQRPPMQSPVMQRPPIQRPPMPQPMATPQIMGAPQPQPMGLTNQYANNVMGKYGMNRGY